MTVKNNIKLNIAGKKLTLNFSKHFANLVKINESLNFGVASNYKKTGLTYVDVPEIVGITGACENVDTLFKVQNRLNLPLFFTQTGQLTLEQSLQSLPGVWTIIHSGRDEELEDERHLHQFRLTEEEFDCTLAGMTRNTYDEEKMFASMLRHIQASIQAIIKAILQSHSKILSQTYQRNIKHLEKASKNNFLKIDYEKAINLLQKNGFPKVQFGDDLKANHEASIVKLLNKKHHMKELPVFITKYPTGIKFFNMKVYTKDPRVVLSADLILPFAGEAVGSAVREHSFVKLNERLITSEMYRLHLERGGKYEDFIWYLDIIKNKKTLPHAGYGVGNDRVLQYIFGEKDIRNTSLFSLLNQQTGDWDKKRYGHAAILTDDKKHILLSIGKMQNKKYLLPYIKKLSQKQNFVFYATRKTHQYLKKSGIITSLVYKISEVDKKPNIGDLLRRRVFDIVINIPTKDKIKTSKEFTDGKLIRRGAIQTGLYLITNPEVASMTIEFLAKKI